MSFTAEERKSYKRNSRREFILGERLDPNIEPKILTRNDDMDNLRTVGIYQIANANTPANAPIWGGANSYIIVRAFWYGSRYLHILFEANGNGFGYRFGDRESFRTWIKIYADE